MGTASMQVRNEQWERRGRWLMPKLLLALGGPPAVAATLLLQGPAPTMPVIGMAGLLALVASAALLDVLVLKPLRARLDTVAPRWEPQRAAATAAVTPPRPRPSQAVEAYLTQAPAPQVQALQKEVATLRARVERMSAEENTAGAALSAAVMLTHDRLLLTDAEGRVRDVSPTALELMDLQRSDLLGKRFHEAVKLYDIDASRPLEHPLDKFLGGVLETRSTLPRIAAALLIDRTGKRLSVLVSAAAILDPTGKLIGALIRLEAYGAKADQPAVPAAGVGAGTTDGPTGLGNARAFERRLDELLKIGRKRNLTHALLFLSPDEFDAVADEHGHYAGEELLWRIGQILKAAAPEGADAFRLGGKHLALLAHDLPIAEAKALAERVRVAVDGAEFKWQDRVYGATVSIAAMPLPPDAEGHKVLLGLANKALASAKASGGNSVAVAGVDAALATRRREDRDWVAWVQQRIKDGHAHLATQAIQPLRHGTRLKPLLDVQLRIADEHGVRVPSAAFLPAVVRHNLTAKFDLWLLRRVIRLLGDQPALVRQFQGVCIEVARPSLTEADFAERVAEVLAEAPTLAPRLCFAIDARCAINHPSDVHRFVGTLEKTGAEFMLTRCKAALGLSALSTLPIQYVRIHESLMRKAAENPLDFGYVRWINQVTHDLGRLTIAAGVDTPALQEVAREIGLDYREGAEVAAPAAGRESAAA